MLRAASDVPGWRVGEVRTVPAAEGERLLAAHPGALVRVGGRSLRPVHGRPEEAIVAPRPEVLCR